MKNKIISLALLGSLLFGGAAYPFRANAILGVADVVIDPGHIAINVLGWAGDAALKALEIAAKSALEAFKKRLLDQFTDETIKWIQGGGSPRFVTDFGGFLEDAGQAAIGDVIQETELGNLCTGLSPARIKFQLQTPVFSQRVSCTLDDIVGNIDRFADSFQSGGFIGYQETLKPQNNRWGLEILASSEVDKRKAEQQDALRQEVSAGRGFLSTKQCLEWEARGTDASGKAVSKTYAYNDSISFPAGPYPDPSEPPPVLVTGINNIKWVCSEERVTTPGTAIAEGLERSLYSDIDYLVNSQELTAYIGAIFDAAINRLILEGARGLQNLKPSGSTSETSCSDSRLDAKTRAACLEFRRAQDEVTGKAKEQEEGVKSAGEDAKKEAEESRGAACQGLTIEETTKCLRDLADQLDNATSTAKGATSTETGADGEIIE